MNRRKFLHGALAAGAAFSLRRVPSWATRRAPLRPNLLILYYDQLRATSLGIYGNPDAYTPHIERLAQEGTVVENAITCAPLCSPSRASLMTGRHPDCIGVRENSRRLPDSEVSLAEVLAEAGYRTGYVGKWHLDAGLTYPRGTPERLGWVPPKRRQGWQWWAACEFRHKYWRPLWFRDKPKPIRSRQYEPYVQAELAQRFLARAGPEPWALMVSFGPPHPPYQHVPPDWNLWDPDTITLPPNVPEEVLQRACQDIALSHGLTASVDEAIGRILDALPELDNTLVVVTADHGNLLGAHGLLSKGMPFDESIRVPLIFRWPRGIRKRSRTLTPISSMDLMPTILSLLDIAVPDKLPLHGEDVSRWLGGTAQRSRPVYSARRRDEHDWEAVRTARWLYAEDHGGPWLLYDRRSDPWEEHNLVGSGAYSAVRRRLHRVLHRIRPR